MRTLIVAALILRVPSRSLGPMRSPRSARPRRPARRSTSSVRRTARKCTHPVLVQFGLKGMGIAPAGVKFDNTGHHHLLIDTDAPADLSAPLPATDKIVHFGKGQTETTLHSPSRQAHAAAAARRSEPHPAQSAGDLEEDHHHRQP